MKKSIVIGTAGHIDHGKTALVKALTGVDTDRLPEEKARGITIDIGFAHMDLDGVEVSFVDVPGHERFIKNMLAGIGGIDLLMLIVAADESIMPQTQEHFDICRLLDIRSGIIVITKSDLVEPDDLALVRDEIEELVRGSFLQDAPIFSVSAKTGDGIDQLRMAMTEYLQALPQRKGEGVFRLPVDRGFTLKGHGTVVTGTLISGRLKRDGQVRVFPSGMLCKVRSIHAHNLNVYEAFAGQRTAVNLQGVDKEEIGRGDDLTDPDFLESTSLLDVKITLLANTKPLVHNSAVRFHHLTHDVPARLTLLGANSLSPGESCFAQLRLQRKIVAIYGDRFILRKHSPLHTIGGGVILDHLPLKRASQNDLEALERMRALEQQPLTERVSIAVKQKGIMGAPENYLKAKLALNPEEILALPSNDVVILQRDPIVAISREAEQLLWNRMQKAVSSFHEKNPLLSGIPKEELRSKYLNSVPSEVFELLLEKAPSLQTRKDLVALKGHQIALSNQEEALAKRIEELLLQGGLVSPGFDQIAQQSNQPVENVKKMLYLLSRQGKAMKMGEDFFVHRQNWEELKRRILALKGTQRTFSIPDFKAIFGITRKYAIPLLEQLDREGITRRSGNERIII